MRIILFKAKRIDTGEWAFGYLSFHKTGKVFIKLVNEDATHSHEIDPETICQYTGIDDKFGKPIFENDLIGHISNRVEFMNGMFVVNGDQPLWMFRDEVIIGNYFDQKGESA